MAEEADKASKTEEPSGKRLEEAGKEGNFARAEEIQVAFGLAGAFVIILFYAQVVGGAMAQTMQGILGHLSEFDLTEEVVLASGRDGLGQMLFLLSPILGIAVFMSVLAGGLQSGFRLAPKALELKGKKLNPVNNFKEKYGMQALVKFGVDLLKLLSVAGVIAFAIRRVTKHPIFHTRIEVIEIAHFINESTLYVLALLIVGMGLVALIHFLYQKQKVHSNLMMTRQEVKDEMKQQEGDQAVKQARRQLAHKLMERQMFAAIPSADVVVTNPTHYAVALRYDRKSDSAPVILAKGRNLIAQNIKRIARESGVPLVENRPAAQALYKIGKTGQAIPSDLFQIVAEILAYVYRTNRKFYRQRQRAVAS